MQITGICRFTNLTKAFVNGHGYICFEWSLTIDTPWLGDLKTGETTQTTTIPRVGLRKCPMPGGYQLILSKTGDLVVYWFQKDNVDVIPAGVLRELEELTVTPAPGNKDSYVLKKGDETLFMFQDDDEGFDQDQRQTG